MPLHDWNDPAYWHSAYSLGAESATGHPSTRAELKLGYHRAVMLPICRTAVQEIVTAMGWTAPGPAIVAFAGGFGWLAEAFEELGFTRVLTIDVSSWVHANKGETEASDIDARITALGLNPGQGDGLALRGRVFDGGVRTRASRGVANNDLSNGQLRNAVRQALGGTVDVVLSDDILEDLSDSEAQTASSRAHQSASQVVHRVTTTRPNQDPGFNWKSLEEWKALLPNDVIIEAGTGRVL